MINHQSSIRPRWQTMKMAAIFIAPYKWQVFYSLIALVFTAAITLSIGQGIRLLIDRGFATHSTDILTQYVSIFFLLVIALAIGTFTRYYWVTWLGERVIADIRRRVFDHLIDLHPGFFEKNRSLEIQSRLTADMTLLQSVIGSSVSFALRNFIMMVGGIIWLFITNAKLTAIVMICVPLVVMPILIFGRRVRKLSRQSQEKVAIVGAYIGEILGQIKTVQAYNHQEIDKKNFHYHVEEAFTVAKNRIIQRALLVTLVIILVLGAVGLMLLIGGMDVIDGKISGGELAAFVFYSVIVGSAVASISEVIGELQRAAGAAERTIDLLATPNEIQSPSKPQTLPPVSGNIEIEHLIFAYPSRPDVRVINELSLTIKAGETLALVGPSGAGKSTLFDLLLRFFDTYTGSIKLEGIDIRQLNISKLRQCFALVSQNPALFHGSIIDNLRYARPDALDTEVEAVAKAAHAHEFICKLPQGYDTQLGDAGLGLSGGQKQRLAIARAILANAPILLLDEATSALDSQSEFWVQQALEKLMVNRTTLVIAHRLSTVKTADRIAVLDQGRLEALGSHAELMKCSELYSQLATLQFQHNLH
ncbi:ABC efflux pump, fused ATPase and inner membrane subunits [Nitrosococcus oceani ATCC 19707]|uniref:ABC efflux pump, fused ATPase and inner membrane subunits n=2 Tax=Nitrosococcus oceani TaxID=1229 RepID=Q3J701_NITOC|nr:ABC transporter transmembrane domain-containing protein [Nitrosococcus oceani]ABA59395.1 ABC efflux pump, fused ATPase and inner membrane subunits [Nitrosococcus oceani ATCC 19707]EDZ66601.1 ABC transporter, permease/ATP-binding protein [Nitrosococcus oceani AFC27]KFI18135.1 ABC transporter ATP-binding protein [Nitrosococcus oceani C-27]